MQRSRLTHAIKAWRPKFERATQSM
jgi:hypothetical protein